MHEPESKGEYKRPGEERVTRALGTFELVVVLMLILLLMGIVVISTLELGWLVVRDILSEGGMVLDVEELFELFGFFLLVLIGMELLVTLKAFLYERIIHVEVVLEVSLIAVAQKVIVLNTSQPSAPILLSLAALLLGLACAYWLVRMTRGGSGAGKNQKPAK